MALLNLALAQFDFAVGAVARNATRVRELMAQARAAGADLVAFPELTLAGYPPEDLLLRPSFLAACERELGDLATQARGIAAFVGHPHSLGEVYNAASLLRDGAVELFGPRAEVMRRLSGPRPATVPAAGAVGRIEDRQQAAR